MKEEKEIDLVELFNIVWLKRKKVLIYGLIGAVVGVVVAISTPNTYESNVIFATESSAGQGGMGASMGALAGFAGFGSGANIDGITIDVYPKIIKSTPFLFEFKDIEVVVDGKTMTMYDYFNDEIKKPWWSLVLGAPSSLIGWIRSSPEEKTVEKETLDIKNLSGDYRAFTAKLNAAIKIDDKSKDMTLEIIATTQSPEVSLILADSVMSKLSRYIYLYKTSKTRNELTNNIKILDDAKLRYYKADSIFAASSDRNQSLVTKSAQITLNRLENERDLKYTIYQQIATQVESTRIKLNEETPIATIIEPAMLANRPIAPNKKMIVVVCIFLFSFTIIFITIAKHFLSKQG